LTLAHVRAPVVLDLQAVQSATYRERGVARYALDFATALARSQPEVLDQVLVRPDLPPASGAQALVDAGLVTTTPRWGPPGGILHALSPFDLDTPIRRLWPREASRAGRRLVLTVYDLIPELHPGTYLADPGTRRRYRARRELLRAADHLMTLSRSAADDLVEHLGIPEDRVTVVGAACSDIFRPTDPGHRIGAGGFQTAVPGLADRYVVYNGAVEPRKNMEQLVRAFAHLPPEVQRGRQLVLVCRLEELQRHHYQVLGQQLGLGDRLLLTGQVSDDTLVALYQQAELVVFPSLYEGYGLPVVEAMACGAPVIASGTSALTELVAPDATFDPTDLDDLAVAIERGLTDQTFRDDLVAWSARPRQTWDDVAARAAGVYRQLLRPPTTRTATVLPATDRQAAAPGGSAEPDADEPRMAAPAAWRRVPLVALVTPWPPAATGVATYSRRLARALSSMAEVELYIDGDNPPATHEVDGYTSYPIWSLPRVDAARGGYDAIIACIGNSEHHTGGLRLVRLGEVDAVVLAHDVRLNGLYWHGEARGAVPEGYESALVAMYPHASPTWMTEGWVQPAEARAYGIFMARELIERSQRFVVTSAFAAELARMDAAPGTEDRIGVSPLAYPRPVRRRTASEQPGLVCTFGLVNEVKQPELLLEAFALLHRADPTTALAYVGPVDAALRAGLEDLAGELGVDGAVTFTGRVDEPTYEQWLTRVSVAVQLRASTNGESSASVADCLAHGVATIVTETGSARELPACVGRVPVNVDPRDLADAIGSLLKDHERRADLAEDGLAHAADLSFERSARSLLAAALEAASGGAPAGTSTATRAS
jgi:glycosyltransferase involved in cell wall biosynthesis